jgi:hypothetical protein
LKELSSILVRPCFTVFYRGRRERMVISIFIIFSGIIFYKLLTPVNQEAKVESKVFKEKILTMHKKEVNSNG